jgi:hypothetical protein
VSVVQKFSVPEPTVEGRTAIEDFPVAATLLSAGLQDDALVVWALVDDATETTVRQLIVTNTGLDIPAFTGTFLGTVTSSTGIVWHVWGAS